MTEVTPEITIVEVGPRDGLQNEPRPIPAARKIELIDLLSAVGFKRIEAASFVSPKWVPQMADGAEVMAGIARRPGTSYAALTPNMRGYEAARAAGIDEIAIFGAASEAFSRKNINCSIAESIERFRPVAEAAKADGMPVRGYISTAIACPYEGPIAPAEVARVTGLLFGLGCYEVSLGDTIGQGTPETVAAMLDAVLAVAPPEKLAGHYHDTNGRALESVAVSIEKGLRVFDAAVGGLGGCPYAPGAKGNLATGALARDLAARGSATGLDLDALDRAEHFVRNLRGLLE
ncbi:MAG: hydroxymethylglutaryl-CoA lyase [Proteobacteria bacterium]|nr:hydroxymethylglutaryl-CoA lyase [Pseudomonadota bacterium]